MPKSPKIPVLVTAATKTVASTPLFHECLDHWKDIAGRLVIVVPQNVEAPDTRGVTFVQVPSAIPSLGDVVRALVGELDGVQRVGAIMDPFTVFRWDIFTLFEIAEKRQLSLSWMATANPLRLIDFDTHTGIDENLLSFFCAPDSIWRFMANREMPDNVPFVTPAWSGWMGTWASKHVHQHKYHDVTDLHAVGRYEDAPVEEVSLDGLGPMTFNAPIRNYVKRMSH